MATVLIISGSPSSSSRTERLAASVARRIDRHDVQASLLDVRDLPAEDLLHQIETALRKIGAMTVTLDATLPIETLAAQARTTLDGSCGAPT